MTISGVIPDTWKDWLRHNRDRGCARDELIQRAMDQGFEREAILAVLNDGDLDVSPSVTDSVPSRSGSSSSWLKWFEAPLTRPDHQPRAWRLDTPLAQVYELPGLLNRDQCDEVIGAINRSLKPSTVTRGSSDYRTSRTCHLRQNSPD